MRARRLTPTVLVTLGVLAGGLVFSSAPALAAAPTIVSESAPSPRAEESRLEALVNPNNQSTECHFQYGEGTVSENTLACEQATIEGGEQGVGLNISSLKQNTTYQYRVLLKNTLGEEAIGTTKPFTTALRPEAPVTLEPELIAGTTATLKGELNPNVTAKDGYYFSYGSEGSCGGASTPPGAETTETKRAVSTPVSGLEGSTEYMVCLVATNEVGEATSGSPVTFRTHAEAPVIEIGSEPVKNIGSRTVTFEANVNPENQETTVVFEYATVPSVLLAGNGTKVPAGASIPPAGGYQNVSELAEALASATSYVFRVTATNASGTSYGPVTAPYPTFTTLAVPLVEETEPEATEVTQHTALIGNITINPQIEAPAEEATYYILYGTTEAYDHASPAPVHPGAGYGLTGKPVPAIQLSALNPGTTYHYAIVGHNHNGTETSSDHQFTTLPATPLTTPPALGAESAQFVNENSAVIQGEINPNGLETTYMVQYGTSAAYGSSTPGSVAIAPLKTAQGTITALVGLTPGTTYHYRLAATNQAGTTYGQDATFTTTGAARTGVFTSFPVPTVPLIAVTPATFPAEAVAKSTPKALTNKQKLAAALKTCRKDKNKGKRATCEKQAHRKYGALKKK
jgi:hypothetical protein